jgi:hypothetical protein
MKRLRLLALLLAAGRPASAALARAAAPVVAASYGALAGPAALAPAALSGALLPSFAASVPLPPPAISATENGLLRAPDAAAGVAYLRRGSYEIHPQIEEIVAKINALRPELPITAKILFLVRDPEVLRRLEIPEDAAGAARIVSDGREEFPVVILAAVRPVPLDEFVEYAVHEAVHLMDDGILRARHDEELKHFFAAGWTQKRAVGMANEILAELGRPATPGKAYRQEIALVEAFIAGHGAGALDELVRTGSDAGLRRALGTRWSLAERLVSGDGGVPAARRRRLDALTALIAAKDIGPDEERVLLDYVRR